MESVNEPFGNGTESRLSGLVSECYGDFSTATHFLWLVDDYFLVCIGVRLRA
jgi:hypothetical protein